MDHILQAWSEEAAIIRLSSAENSIELMPALQPISVWQALKPSARHHYYIVLLLLLLLLLLSLRGLRQSLVAV